MLVMSKFVFIWLISQNIHVVVFVVARECKYGPLVLSQVHGLLERKSSNGMQFDAATERLGND